MRTLRPVRWKEGMFLRPHHFQQLELFLESRGAMRARALSEHAWGVLDLALEESALDNFTLEVGSLQAILPEGTLVSVPENAHLPSRELSAVMTESGRALDVSVGVRRRAERSAQTREEDSSSASARYRPRRDEVYDLETGDSRSDLETLEYEMRFFLGEEPTDGYEVLPIARLLQSGNPAKPVIVDPAFAPPVLLIGASRSLIGTARAVVERLGVTLRAMRGVQAGQDAVQLTLYQALSSAMPVLREMVEDGGVHPRLVYRELARLAGTLLFRDETGRSHEAIPLYDHREPAPVFEALRALIDELSEPVIARRWHRVPFTRAGDLYSLSLPPEVRTPGARFFLEVEADASTPKVRNLILAAKVSAPGRIETLRGHALPGVATEALPGAPPELPPGQTGSYFRLKNEEEEWGAHVTSSEELAAFVLGAPDDVALNLIVVLPG